jgi:histidine triad (HIT) family protein
VAIQQTLNPQGLNLLQCNGPAAAQSVMHFHVHVLPRKNDDNVAMNWPLVPGNMDEIRTIANSLRSVLV